MTRREFLKRMAFLTLSFAVPFPAKVFGNTFCPAFRDAGLAFPSPLEERSGTNAIVIHHSNMDSDSPIENIHSYHINTKGWNGVGYHFYIRKDGTIEIGRPMNTVGAHTWHGNDYTVGICLAGSFNYENPTEAQYLSTAYLVGYISEQYGLVPDESNILGHRQFSVTDCPGNILFSNLWWVREAGRECLDSLLMY